MKFKVYLNEAEMSVKDGGELMDIIRRDCKPFLRERKKGQFLGRGSARSVDYFEKITPRTDRRPRDMFQERHEKLDKAFNEEFGGKPRSQGVFCYGGSIYAEMYGEPFLVFPIGKFRYLGSPSIKDLYTQIGALLNRENMSYEEIVKTYIEDNLDEAISRQKYEIIIGCKAYYLVNESFIHPSDVEQDDDYFKDLENL